MQITATMVKELRERTGAGMMECKKALTEANGDSETAVEIMRKSGMAKADKKTSRVAADGLVEIKTSSDNKTAVMLEINSETDFVAKGDDFLTFVNLVTNVLLEQKIEDKDALLNAAIEKGKPQTVEEYRLGLVAKVGENIQIRRFVKVVSADGLIGAYSHGGRIGVIAELKGGDAALAKDIAMHVAASRPVCVSEKDVPAEHFAKEKEILIAQSADSGKPKDIIEKMVEGRLKKYLAEVTLLGQPFVKDPDVIVSKLLKSANAEVKSFTRYEVGEGIEKKEDNFVEEVMAQARA